MPPSSPERCNHDVATESAIRELSQEVRGLRDQMISMAPALKAIEEKLGDHHGSLYGWEDKPGAIIRLDRVERAVESVRWFVWAVGGGVVALVVDAVRKWWN